MNPITRIQDHFSPNSDSNLMKKGFEPAADTSSQQELSSLILQGHTQHLNSRPPEGIGLQPANIQEGLFAANFVTKAEGNHEEAVKGAFDKIEEARIEYFAGITPAVMNPLLPPPGTVRTAINAAGLTEAYDTTKSPLERHLALLKTKAHVDSLPTAVAAPLKGALNEIYSSPKKLVTEVQLKLVNRVLNDIASIATGTLPTELASLNTTELAASTTDSIIKGNLSTQTIERLSTIIAALPDAAMRKSALESLRGAVILESLRGISLTAAGSETDPKYDQYLMALADKFVFRAGGVNSDALGKLLADTLYKKGEAEEAIKVDIAGNAQLNAYLTELLNQTAPGTTVETELKVNGLSSKGDAFGKTHELLGIVRRGAEAAEWYDLKTKPPADKETYLVTNFGYTAGSQQLHDAVTRLDTLLAAGTAGTVTLTDLITAAADNSTTDFGDRYTNLMRAQRNYLETGGDLLEAEKGSEVLDANQFIRAIQTQANPELGVAEGGVASDRNRVLTVEEQRATVLADYEALSGKKGIRGWVDKLKKVVPRIAKAVGLMALATAGAAVPVLAGPLAIGFAAVRLVGVVSTVKMGIPTVKNAIASKNWKALGAAALGIGVNVAAQAFLPGPLAMGITLVGETIGTEIYAERQLSKEVVEIRNAHMTYEAAFQTKIDSLDLTNADDLAFATKLARAINVDINDPTLAGAAGPDKDLVVQAILTSRENAHSERNMMLLRSFSQVMEERMTAERDVLNTENLAARRIYDEAQQTITAYAVASSATKLGFGMARGFSAGYEKGGIFGGLAGALGIGNLFEKSESVEKAEAYTEVRKELEADFDRHATALGISNEGHNVVGLVEGADGTDYAAVDLDGDPTTPEMFVHVDHMSLDNPSAADLNFTDSHIGHLASDSELFRSQVSLLTGTPLASVQSVSSTDDSTLAAFSTPHGQFALVVDDAGQLNVHTLTTSETGATIIDGSIGSEAVGGDSQWSLIEKTLRASYPSMTDQEVWTATANTINEAGSGEVYHQVFEHRTVGISGGSIQIGDRLTITDIREMAPNTFASLPGNPVETPGVSTVIPGVVQTEMGGVMELGVPNASGVMVFDLEGNNHTLYGTFTPGSVVTGAVGIGGAGDDGQTTTASASSQSADNSTTETSTTTTTQSNNVFGYQTGSENGVNVASGETVVTRGTGGAGTPPGVSDGATATTTNSAPETGSHIDTITISDPGIGGGHYTIYEDTVSKVIVEQRLSGAPAFELDPKTHDILNIDPGHSITYKTPDGLTHTLEASGPIKLEFVGNEGHPIDVASGQQSILSSAGDVLTNLSGQIEGASNDVVRIGTAMNELNEDLSRFGYHDNPYFDPGFGNIRDYMLQHNYVASDGSQAWMDAISVESNGDHTIIPYENVIKITPNSVTYTDLSTNNVLTATGTNIVGIGTTYSHDPATNTFVYGTPQQFVFTADKPVSPQPVENPWWDPTMYGPDQPGTNSTSTQTTTSTPQANPNIGIPTPADLPWNNPVTVP